VIDALDFYPTATRDILYQRQAISQTLAHLISATGKYMSPDIIRKLALYRDAPGK
jgi:hypothetical protein